MFWIDLSEHNLSVWDARGVDELHSDEGDIIVMPIRSSGQDPADQLIVPFIQSGGFYDKTIKAVRLKQLPPMDFWMERFDRASIRWLPASETMPTQIAISANEKRFLRSEQWLFAAIDPNPHSLGLAKGSHLSPMLTAYALTEIDARAIGNKAVAVPAGRVYPIADHPDMDGVLYGVSRNEYNQSINYANELPFYDDNSESTQSSQADLDSENNQVEEQNEPDERAEENSGKREDYGRSIPFSRRSVSLSMRDFEERDNPTGTKLEIREMIKTKMSIGKSWPKKDIMNLIKDSGDGLPIALMAATVRESLYKDYTSAVPLIGKGSRNNRYISSGGLFAGGISIMTATLTARSQFELAVKDNADLAEFIHRLTTETVTTPMSSSGGVLGYYVEFVQSNRAYDLDAKSKKLGMNAGAFVDPYWIDQISRNSKSDIAMINHDKDGAIDIDWLMEKSNQARLPGEAIFHAMNRNTRVVFWTREAMIASILKASTSILAYMDIVNPTLVDARDEMSSTLSQIHKEALDPIHDGFSIYEYDLKKTSLVKSNEIESAVDIISSRDYGKANSLVDETMDLIRANERLSVSAFTIPAQAYIDAVTKIEKLAEENGMSLRDLMTTDMGELRKKTEKEQKLKMTVAGNKDETIESDQGESQVDDEMPPKISLAMVPVSLPSGSELSASNGIDWRKGQDVTEEQLCSRFGFNGIQYGSYVNQSRRSEMLNSCYDALADIAYALEMPCRFMGLNGEMALAFGARGRGGRNAAAAHYEPTLKVINFTRDSGAGTLAHEMAHSLDNYFGRKFGKVYLSESDVPSRWRAKVTADSDDNDRLAGSMGQFIDQYGKRSTGSLVVDEQVRKAQSSAKSLMYADFDKKVFGGKKLAEVAISLIFESRHEGWVGEKDADALRKTAMNLRDRIGAFIEESKDKGAVHLTKNGSSTTYDRVNLATRIEQWAKDEGQALTPEESSAVKLWTRDLLAPLNKLLKAQHSSMVNGSSVIRGQDESGFLYSGVILDAVGSKKKPYWSSEIEYFARAMSSVIYQVMNEEGVRNDWAAGISKPSVFDGAEYLTSPNLEGQELLDATKVFRESFLPAIRKIAHSELGDREITQAERSMHEARRMRRGAEIGQLETGQLETGQLAMNDDPGNGHGGNKNMDQD